MDTEAICLGLVITELGFVAVFLQFYFPWKSEATE